MKCSAVRSLVGSLVLVVGLGMAWHEGAAQTTNIIWRAKVNGTMGIQQHTTTLNRVMQTEKFKTGDFVKMILDIVDVTPTGNQVLALNINVQGNTTNFFLSVYDKVTRQNLFRITTNEVTVLLEDNKQYSSSMACGLVGPRGQRGELVIAGRGKESHGYPITQNAKIGGYLIDPFPTDMGGTTGLFLQATLKTSGKPLRVEPPFVPGSP